MNATTAALAAIYSQKPAAPPPPTSQPASIPMSQAPPIPAPMEVAPAAVSAPQDMAGILGDEFDYSSGEEEVLEAGDV